MRPTLFLSRFSALLLAFSLSLPQTAWALRVIQGQQSPLIRSGLEEVVKTTPSHGSSFQDQILQLQRQLFSIDPKGKAARQQYRQTLTALGQLLEPGHQIDERTFFFIRIGSKLRLGDPEGSVTNPLFNHLFRVFHLPVVMIPIDFSLLGVDSQIQELYYDRLLSFILEDPQTVGFAAGYPLKDRTQQALRNWGLRQDVEQLDKAVGQLTAGGLVKTHLLGAATPNGWPSQGISALVPGQKKLSVISLMTSGDAWVKAVEVEFPAEFRQNLAGVVVYGATGATGDPIARSLAVTPWVKNLFLVDVPAKGSELRDLAKSLQVKGRSQAQPFLSETDSAFLKEFHMPGLNELNQRTGQGAWIFLDATPGARPLRQGQMPLLDQGDVVLTLTYRPDPLIGLREAAHQGADTRNGVNLLVTDNLDQVRGILLALGVDPQKLEDELTPAIHQEIIHFLEARGLHIKSLTPEVETEAQLRKTVKQSLPRFQGDLLSSQIIRLLERKEELPRYSLCLLVREDFTTFGLLDGAGQVVSTPDGLRTISVPTPSSQDTEEFFGRLLQLAKDEGMLSQTTTIGGIAAAVVGQVDEYGNMSVSHVKQLEGQNLVDPLRRKAREFGIEGPVVVVNDAEVFPRGSQEPFLKPGLHFIIRLGGVGAAWFDGKQWLNLEPGLKRVGRSAAAPTLEEMVSADDLVQLIHRYNQTHDPQVEQQIESRLDQLAQSIIRLVKERRATQLVVGLSNELAVGGVYARLLHRTLRDRWPKQVPFIEPQIVEANNEQYLRGALAFLQTDTHTLLKVLLGILVDSTEPQLLRSTALRLLREVLRSRIAEILRDNGRDRSIDQIRQLVLEQARAILHKRKTEESELIQQAVFTLGVLGNQTDLVLLRSVEVDFQESGWDKIRGAAQFSEGELAFRLKQNPCVVNFLLRRREKLSASVVKSGQIQGLPLEIDLPNQVTPDELLRLIAEQFVTLANQHNLGFHEITGVAVGVGAELDKLHQKIMASNHFPKLNGIHLRRRLTERLERVTQDQVPIETSQGHQLLPVRYSIPVWLMNDEEALAEAEARKRKEGGIYIHLGEIPRVWLLKDGHAVSAPLPDQRRQELSSELLVRRAKEGIRELASSLGLSVDELAQRNSGIRTLLSQAPGETDQERLDRFSVGQMSTWMGRVLKPGGDRHREAGQFAEPFFQELAGQIAEVIGYLEEDSQNGSLVQQGTVVLGGGLIHHNRFLVNEIIPKALHERGKGRVRLAFQAVHPREHAYQVLSVLADHVYEMEVAKALSSEGTSLDPTSGLEERRSEVPPVEILHSDRVGSFQIKGILWDVDGTLWIAYPRIVGAYCVAEAFGLDLGDLQIIQKMSNFLLSVAGLSWDGMMDRARREGWPVPEGLTYQRFVERTDFENKLVTHVHDYRLTDPKIALPKGLVELLTLFRTSGFQQSVATGGKAESRDLFLKEMGIRDFFEEIQGGGNKGQTIREKMEEWGFQPHELALISDGPEDIEVAQQEGILAVGYAETLQKRDAFLKHDPEHQPDIIINQDYTAHNEIFRAIAPHSALPVSHGSAVLAERLISLGGHTRPLGKMLLTTFPSLGEGTGLSLAHAARDIFVASTEAAIQQRGRFVVALAGGRTPQQMYRLLPQTDVDWDKIHVFWGDERPPRADGTGTGYQVVWETFLKDVPIPPSNVHRVNLLSEGNDRQAEARRYEDELWRVLGENLSFDLIILGVGTDGHTLSLMPGSPVFNLSSPKMVEVVPREDAGYGYTLTPPVLEKARKVLLLISGQEKQSVLDDLIAGQKGPPDFPVGLLNHLPVGVVHLLTDLPLPTGLEEKVLKISAERLRLLPAQDQAEAALRDLTALGTTVQVLGQGLVEQFPPLAALAEISRGKILIDRGGETTLDLIAELISRGVQRVDYYGGLEGAERFAVIAQTAHISARVYVPGDRLYGTLLLQILSNLSGFPPGEIRRQVDTVSAWLAQLA